MADSRDIKVFYERFVVGNVSVHKGERIGFTYDPRWLATNGNFPLSLTMPLSEGEISDEVVAPWLANLLPEEQQLMALSRALGLSTSDTLAILEEIGGDTAGAISIGEPSNRSDWAYDRLQSHYDCNTESAALDRHFDDLGRRPFMVGEDGVRLSLAGGQKKTVLAVLDERGMPKLGLPEHSDVLAVPKTGAPSTIIIKPDNPTLPGIVENEAYCLALARHIGLLTAEATILTAGSRTALAVARYDRKLRQDGSIRRLHQEDFAQASGLYPGQKYEQGTVAGLSLAALLGTRRHLPPAEALKLLDQFIFNILVANTDAHAKNYSMLLGNEASVAPLYDVSSVLPWEHVNQYHAQKLAGRRRKPGDMARRHWDRIAEEVGLNGRNLRQRVQELVDLMIAKRVKAVAAVSANQGAEAGMVEHVADLIEQNALRIAGRLW